MGGADVGRTVWRVADNLEKTLLCNFYFRGQIFYLYMLVFIWSHTTDDGHVRVELMMTSLKGRHLFIVLKSCSQNINFGHIIWRKNLKFLYNNCMLLFYLF